MEERTIKSAIISTDDALRSLLQKVVATDEIGIKVGLEVIVPFPEINDSHLEQLRQLAPDLIFLDIADDPIMGLKFAQFLIEGAPNRRIIGLGDPLTPDLLLQAMQAGVSEYLPKPVTEEKVQDAIDRIARKFGHRVEERRREPGKLLAFFSPKGGAGSTCVATNTAISLHQLTRGKVLLVDLDLELGETALLLGVEPRFSFVDLVRNFHRVDAGLLASYIERHDSGVELLSAPFHPAKAETVTGDQIRQILHFVKQHYDWVVVDTSKSFTPPTLATFEQADNVFLVTNVDLPSLRNITRCLPLLERMGQVKGDDWLQIVVNRYQPSDPITLKEIEKTLGIPVYWTLSNDYESVMNSINSGKPVVLSDKSAFARDMRAFVMDVTGSAPKRDSRSSLIQNLKPLKKFFGRSQSEARGEAT
ncbi:MAG: AAA family ATPase [marine benthic group bacterium]|nr:AAA family ATPase [Gemmatimonadota bacterium]